MTMKTQLLQALEQSIDALTHVPGTQLQTIEATLRQLMTDLKEHNITPPAELDDLIEDAAIAHFEDMAYMNGVAMGDEPYFNQNYWEEYEENFIMRSSPIEPTPHPTYEGDEELPF